MKRVLIVAFTALCGCNAMEPDAGRTVTLEESPFEPGVYAGLRTCVATLVMDGVTTESGDQSSSLLIIGDDGLPLVNGETIAPGVIESIPLGDATFTSEITAVTVYGSGIIVDYEIRATSGGPVIAGPGQDHFTLSADGRGIIYVSTIAIFSTEPGAAGSISSECGAELAK